jgi:hypothetical protein
MNGCAGKRAMTNNNSARRHGEDEVNPKIDPAPNSNTEKEPDDWVSGDDPMTGAQASYLKNLSEVCGEPDAFTSDLTKAEASKRIDALKSRRGRRAIGAQQ